MISIYNLAIRLYCFIIYIASNFNKKAFKWIEGRKNLFKKLEKDLAGKKERRVWFHCASLGEFEQGRPVIEEFKKKFPGLKIVLTFFSPSGYEVRKNYQGADYIYYLPHDTERNATRFIELVNPEKVFFIKYEFWYHYFDQLHKKNIPSFIISGIFRKDQIFFRWYGGLFRRILRNVSFFYVQNKSSQDLLNSIGIKNCIVSGDTRFDRVYSIAQHSVKMPRVENFIDGNPNVFIAGSTWPADEDILVDLIDNDYRNEDIFKFIIAPHEIDEIKLRDFEEHLNIFRIPNARFSRYDMDERDDVKVLIIDNIGYLSSVYKYGSFAYIGGGFGSGIHNILEAAVFGCPLFFGPNYKKFHEAVELVSKGSAIQITSAKDLIHKFRSLRSDENKVKSFHDINLEYIREKKGATEMILNDLDL